MSKQQSGGGPNYFVEHGEKIGLGIAGGLALILFMLGMSSMVFSANSDELAEDLNKKTAQIDAQFRSARPTEADLPPKNFSSRVVTLDNDLVLAARYEMAALRGTGGETQVGRRVPTIFPVEEAAGAVARVQIKTYDLYTKNGELYISMLKTEGAGGAGNLAGRFGGEAVMPPPAGGTRGGRGDQPYAGPMGGVADSDKKKDIPIIGVPVKKLEKSATGSPVVLIRPHRLAVLAFSFPFKKQVEEFRTKLGLRSTDEVLSESSLERPEKSKGSLAAFRFVGVNVRRRELDGNGNPVGKGDWTVLNLGDSYREFIRSVGKEFEKDTGEYTQLTFPGLVMPKLKQFRPEDFGFPAVGGSMYGPGMGGYGTAPMGVTPPGRDEEEGSMAQDFKETPSQYPPVEKELRLLARAMEQLKDKGPVDLGGPKRFSDDDFDPFAANQEGPGTGRETGPGGPGMNPPFGMPPDMYGPGGPGTPRKPQELPEHCLVRIIDVTVEPGKIYEYQVQIRMANPNYKRPDVASGLYADGKYLDSEWSTMPVRVAVTPELVYYAVDQMLADGKGRKPGTPDFDKSKYIAIQAHRWLTEFQLAGARDTKMVVGEWAVAERFPVGRGMYLGRRVPVKLPVWRPQQQSYVLPDLTQGRRKDERVIQVPFEYDEAQTRRATAPQAILVDFEQRGERSYDRIVREADDDGPERRQVVSDSTAGHALIMNPDGRLILREAALDLADPERSQRLADFRKRIKEVEKKGKANDDPFGSKIGP